MAPVILLAVGIPALIVGLLRGNHLLLVAGGTACAVGLLWPYLIR